MQQRRPRLGDIVDDYCPRERRITNHAVVAMIEDEVKQTRCTTCDADHEYKHAKVPAQRRKKDAPADLLAATPRKRPAVEAGDADAVEIADAPEPLAASNSRDAGEVTEGAARADAAAEGASAVGASAVGASAAGAVPLEASAAAPEAVASRVGETLDTQADAEPATPEDDGPVHRRLIRATLPRPEGQLPERKPADFTMHQRETNGNRAGRGPRRGPRPGQMRAQQGNGQPSRFGGQRQGPGGGQRHGSGHGQQGPRPPGDRTGQGQGQPGQPRHNRNRKRGR
jgi:hypothetical protein